jgi:hypothetical protein
MGWRPQLNVVCGRCGKPSAFIGHVCVSNSRRKRTLKPKLTFGRCPDCRKAYDAGGPLTHHCAPKSDFRKRKKKYEQEQRAKARKERPKHDYTECSDDGCKRSLCAAYKAGIALGEERGQERGWQQGYARGLAERTRESKLGELRAVHPDRPRDPRRVGAVRPRLPGQGMRGVPAAPRPVPGVQGQRAQVPARRPDRPRRGGPGVRDRPPEAASAVRQS